MAYHPSEGASDTGTLSIGSNGGRGKGLQIPLSGQGLNLAPCRFAISPTALDLGNGPPDGGELQGSFIVQNLGTEVCLVRDLAIQNDPSNSFQIVSTTIQPDPSGWFTIPVASGPAGGMQVTVAFTPLDAGASTASADFWISDPAQVDQQVPLRATSGNPCLVFVPPTLDFGKVGENDGGAACLSATRSITVFNQCGTADTLQSVGLQSTSGDATAQFSAPAGATLPLSIDTSPQTFTLNFQPTTPGSHAAQLVFSDGVIDSLVPIEGDAVAGAMETDSFVAGTPKVDLLFIRNVGDDSYSEPLVAADMADFLDAGAGTDYRLAVTTDDDPRNPEPNYGGWLQPCPSCYASGPGPVVVSPSSTLDGGSAPDPVAVFVDLLGAGGGGSLDIGTLKDVHLFVALFEALERDPRPGFDFFRPGAYFAVVNESGEYGEESFSVRPIPWFESFFTTWFPDPALFSWNCISPSFTVTGTGLADPLQLPPAIESMVSLTGGLAVNTQDANWPQPLLSLWSVAAAANLRYHLTTAAPAGSSGMTVAVNGAPVLAPAWTYDATANAVVFQSGNASQNGDQIQVSYPIGCR